MIGGITALSKVSFQAPKSNSVAPTAELPKLVRSPFNPILSPERVESILELPKADFPVQGRRITGVFNPAASVAFLPSGEKRVVLLFRIYDRGTKKSFIGLAESKDGAHFDKIEPKLAIFPTLPEEAWGVEDPRIAYFPEEKLYAITYTGYSKEGPCVCLITTPNLLDPKQYVKHGKILKADNKDAVFFPEKINGKYVLLHRPYPNIALAYASKLTGPWSAEKSRILVKPETRTYRSGRVGAGAPPIKTPLGWLLPIHGAQKYEEGNRYRMGWLLLDLKNPEKILYLSEKPVLSPQKPYEIHTSEDGPIPQLDLKIFPQGAQVVFPEGMVEWGDRYLVYYGAADEFVGMASVNKTALLNALKQKIGN
jgi:predicted GH43/DUF377 family glycosyl hydrolase